MTEWRTFTREFDGEAARLASQGTDSQSEVARRLGIGVGSLRKCMRAAEGPRGKSHEGGRGSTAASPRSSSALEAELRRLRAENERLKTEREVPAGR